MSDSAFLIAGQASLGGVVGFVVGMYSVKQKSIRARAERLGEQLTVLNRVLRHDIRNEATVIQGRADILSDESNPEEHLQAIEAHTDKLVDLSEQAQLVDRLLRDGEPDRVEVDLAEVIETNIDRVERSHPSVEIDASTVVAERVYAHPLIDSAIGNILDNAVQHNDAATPTLHIESGYHYHAGVEYVEVRISDNGPGIPDSEIEVLERGYETPLEHMKGLGLWLVHWIIRASNGEVHFEENEPRGSVVVIRLKRAP